MLEHLWAELQKSLEHLRNEFAKLQVGRANPGIVEGVMVSAYGSVQPLKNVASVSILDAQTLAIQPWDKSLIKDIDRSITEANLWLNPQNNGESILIKIPTLTEERRRDLVKIAHRLTEEGRVAIRNIRADYMKRIKQELTLKKISEDVATGYEQDLQKAIDQEMKTIDALLEHKEVEIMKV